MKTNHRWCYVAAIQFIDDGEVVDRICSSIRMAVAHAGDLAGEYDMQKPDYLTVRRHLQSHHSWHDHDENQDMSLYIARRRLY